MAKINLKDYYRDYYHEDYIIDTPDEVAELLQSSKRESLNRKRNVIRQHSHYSLNYHNGVEAQVSDHIPSAEELFLELQTSDALTDAINSLSPTHARRIVWKYFDKLSTMKIYKTEYISAVIISYSLKAALKNLKNYFAKKCCRTVPVLKDLKITLFLSRYMKGRFLFLYLDNSKEGISGTTHSCRYRAAMTVYSPSDHTRYTLRSRQSEVFCMKTMILAHALSWTGGKPCCMRSIGTVEL